MLLTITCAAREAMDFGYLISKNPAAANEWDLAFGVARVFYTEATDERCTVALQVEVDSVGLVRGRAESLAEYVSDRPYAPSSFLSVAIAEVFRSALNGRSRERPERVQEKMPLTATLYSVACDTGESLMTRLFSPLGYTVTAERLEFLDKRFPEWGAGNVYTLTLAGETTVRDLLTHLYVLIPVLDNAKHYRFGADEVEKLLEKGAGWLETHPEKELITRRFLRYKRELARAALAELDRLAAAEEVPVEEILTDTAAGTDAPRPTDAAEASLETRIGLNQLRIEAAVEAVKAQNPPARRVLDLGCGEGRYIAALLKEMPGLEHIAGMDASTVALTIAARRLHLDNLSERQRERVSLFHGSLVYRDKRLEGYDTALLCEVIEHLDPDRLRSLERVVFEFARPRRVIITTPNAEYNAVWPSLPSGKFRHADHRFEWTRQEFSQWTETIAARFGYTVRVSGVGPEDSEGRGTPTQMAILTV